MRQRVEDYDERDNFLGVVGSEDRVAELSEQRRMLPMALITVVVMMIFAGGLWFAYVQGARHAVPAAPAPGAAASASASASSENVPLIRADQRPLKLKPDQPGGMDVPDRDKLVFNEKAGGPSVEKLLPPPEAPAPLPGPAPKEVAAAPPFPAMAANSAAPGKPAQQQDVLQPVSAKPEPAKPAAANPGGLEKTAVAARPLPASAAPPQSGGVRVQLGSLRSPDAARDEWQRLKRINSDLLSKLTAVAVRAEVPDKGTYYRIEAGPLTDAAAAGRLCGELKKRNLGCTIVR